MKLLICHGVYIGDVILATSILPVLKKADPSLEIGLMVGSWANEVVLDHRFVDRVHLYDHPCFNRSFVSMKKKKKRAKEMRKEVLNEIKAIGYDAALHLSSLYAADLLFQSAIPRRISHLLVKTPFFFNELYSWELLTDHIVDNHKRMLGSLGIDENHLTNMAPVLDYKTPFKSHFEGKLPEKYLLIHMGSADFAREWPVNNWKELVGRLTSLQLPFVFVGKGEREKKHIQEVKEGLSHAIDLSDQLSFRELIEAVKRSACVIGVESMCGHVTAAMRRPGVFIYSGYAAASLWRPYSPTCHIVTPKGCDPFRENSDPFLVRTITPDAVEAAVREVFVRYKKECR